jgi:Flp pilus assembly protein TadD
LSRAVDLSPRDPNLASYGTVLAAAYILLRQPDKAEEWARVATRQPSSHFIAHMHLAAALALRGNAAEARKAKETLLQLKPDFTGDYVTKVWPFRRSTDAEKIVEALRKAGL